METGSIDILVISASLPEECSRINDIYRHVTRREVRAKYTFGGEYAWRIALVVESHSHRCFVSFVVNYIIGLSRVAM